MYCISDDGICILRKMEISLSFVYVKSSQTYIGSLLYK